MDVSQAPAPSACIQREKNDNGHGSAIGNGTESQGTNNLAADMAVDTDHSDCDRNVVEGEPVALGAEAAASRQLNPGEPVGEAAVRATKSAGLESWKRRALTLLDVVTECHGNGPLKAHRLLMALLASLGYWYFIMPLIRDWGAGSSAAFSGVGTPGVAGAYPRAGGPWAEVRWEYAGLVTLCYLMVVCIGLCTMAGRPLVEKHIFEHMLVYNIMQAALNCTLAFNLWREAWRLEFQYPWGNTLDFSPVSHRLGMLLWFQYHCRQLELLDAVFIILRKKFHPMSCLHIGLRLVHMWGWFFVCRCACGGDSYFPAAVNCTCQVFVYAYYAQSMLRGPGGTAPITRSRVTEMQVLQFIVCATHSLYVLIHGHLPRAVAALSLAIMVASLVLFVEWEGGQPHPRKNMEMSMFAHMFQQQPSLVDLRRRALTLIDVVVESEGGSPMRPHRLLTAFLFSLAYWFLAQPIMRSWSSGTGDSGGANSSAGGPWAEVRWWIVSAVTLGYLAAVFLGVGVMSRRPPAEKRVFEYMLVYNLTQVALNAALGVALWREAWRLGYQYPWGNALDFSPAGHRLGMLLWLQYHCRQLELLDTAFIIVRKKFQRMTFLHIFLRLVHMWGWFFVCRYACGGDSYFPAAVNCTCQVVVYAYYALSLVSGHGAPLVRRAWVTEVQVFQFVICATHAVYVLVHGHLPRSVAALSLVVMASGLVLYVEWDGGHPHIRPREQIDMTMFGHMFGSDRSLTDLRRRAMTLIDVVAEREGPMRPHRLVAAFLISLMYWFYVLPALRDWGTGHWYRHGSKDGDFVRAGGPWGDVSGSFAVVVTMIYLFCVFAGVRVMERRPPVQARVFEYMFIYNTALVMLNASLGFTLWREAWHLGFPYPWGNSLDTSEAGHKLGMLLWFQYHCRQLELFDTFFVILRKKFHALSYLQIFLRLAHMWGWFLVCRFACGGDSYFPAAVNCTCQVLVYSYYALSLIQEHGVPLMRKGRVTEVQIFQFVLCALHSCYVLYSGNLPRAVAALSLVLMGGSLLLYTDFAGDQARLKPRHSTNGEGAHEQLTFRFDSSGWFYVYHFGVALWIQEHLLPEGLAAEDCVTSRYPAGLAFSGSSGGALVAASLATGVDTRAIFEFVMEQQPSCKYNPMRMFTAVEAAMRRFLPPNSARSMTGRVRVLLTRVSSRLPFVTGEVVDQFDDWPDVFGALRATCHVPGLHLFPYSCHGRHYYDGLIWSSMLVPWSGQDARLVVKVSATSTPLTDIRAPLSPPWWIIFPPSLDALRGLFWVGYRDAAAWFSEQSEDPLDRCKCTMQRRQVARAESVPDPLLDSRFAKHRFAQKLLLRRPKPLDEALPATDPTTGQAVEELIAAYKSCAEKNFRAVAWASGAVLALGASLVLPLALSAF